MTYSAVHAPVTAPSPTETHSDVVDRLPAALRSCVHEFGYSVVHAFVLAGITRPNIIRHLIDTVYRGARELGNARLTYQPGAGVLGMMDDVLRIHGAPAVARPLVMALRRVDFTIIQREPTDDMVEASCAALADVRTVTYERKHKMRLRAAIKRGDAERWVWLDAPA